jgi:hypothetical protein
MELKRWSRRQREENIRKMETTQGREEDIREVKNKYKEKRERKIKSIRRYRGRKKT